MSPEELELNFTCIALFCIKTRICLKYFVNDCRFSGVFSRNKLPKVIDGAYVINLDDLKSKETHSVSLFIDRNTAAYFDSFRIEYIFEEVLSKIRVKSFTHNIMQDIQDNDPVMCVF